MKPRVPRLNLGQLRLSIVACRERLGLVAVRGTVVDVALEAVRTIRSDLVPLVAVLGLARGVRDVESRSVAAGEIAVLNDTRSLIDPWKPAVA